MLLSEFKESVAFPFLCKFLPLVPTIFIPPAPTHSHVFRCHCLFARWEIQLVLMVQWHWPSSKSTQMNTCSESKSFFLLRPLHLLHSPSVPQKVQEAAKGANCCPQRQPLAVGWCYPLRGAAASAPSQAGTGRSLAVVYYVCGVLMQIQIGLWSCNIRQVAMCKAHNLSTLRNTSNHSLFLWESLLFSAFVLSSMIQLSTELGMCGACES